MSTAAPAPDHEASLAAAHQRMYERLMRPLLEQTSATSKRCAEEEANPLSKAFLVYMHDVMNVAVEKDDMMEVEDIDRPMATELATTLGEDIERRWALQMQKPAEERSIIRVVLASSTDIICPLIFWLCFSTAGPFTSIVLMRYVANFVSDPSQPYWWGLIYAAIFIICQVLFTVGSAQESRIMNGMGLRIQAGLRMAISRKVMNMTPLSMKAAGGAGFVYQVFSSSTMDVSGLVVELFRIVPTLLQVVAAFVYLFILIGWPVVTGLAVFAIVLPFNYKLANSFIGLFIAKMMAGDERTKKVVEVLNSIKAIKMYGWAEPIRKKIAALREPELQQTSSLLQRIAFLMCSFGVAGPTVQIVIFITLISTSPAGFNTIVFFQALGLIQMLSLSMIMLPFMYSNYIRTRVSSSRVEGLLGLAQEKADYITSLPLEEGTPAVDIKDAVFSWDVKSTEPVDDGAAKAPPAEGAPVAAEAPKLTVPRFEASAGDLVMVVGKLGAGKSTLMNVIAGDVPVWQGTAVRRSKRIAFVPQNPWILNATVRNNIVVNLPFDQTRYDDVLSAVDFHADLAALPNGDLTEVGEKGINLSGGQKQRVSIARALYSDADMYLFDDPLSALDAHVGRHVFDHAIEGLLAGKTRILVTNQMQYLPHATRLYVIDGMALSEHKMPLPVVPEEKADDEAVLIQLLRAWQGTRSASSPQISPTISPTSRAKPKKESSLVASPSAAPTAGRLTVREERQSGQVSSSTFLKYLKSFGGCPFWFTTIMFNLFVIVFDNFSRIWIGMWQAGQLSFTGWTNPGYFLGIYVASMVVSAIFIFFRELVWRVGAVNAPRQLYDAMVNAVFRTYMAFFDTTPTGRIINRFTRDSEQLDFALPMAANQVIGMFFAQIGSLSVICIYLPYFAPIAAAVLIALIFVQPTVATIVMRRLSSSVSGPMMALFSETMGGTTSIRSYGLTSFFMERFAARYDENTAASKADRMIFETVRVRVNILMAFLCGALILIITQARGTISSGFAALVIQQTINVTMWIGYMMMQRGQLALALNSIERMAEYIELPAERDGDTTPAKEWPTRGEVELKELTCRYRDDLPDALTDVSVTFKGGEKVGVVGRTGSGKSSMLLTLFRMIPIRGGSLLIDGVDTASMPLERLRTAIAAIPQEPVLFTDTVRNNMDPFNETTDDKIIASLQLVKIWDVITKKVGKDSEGADQKPLDIPLTDSSLSVGEKQLLCLARAIARDTRIIVLDEATSSVDPHTDALIQETIRTSFKHCTVITVAHRINTILDSDKIVVLDKGRVKEFGTPDALMHIEHGIFKSLVDESQSGAS